MKKEKKKQIQLSDSHILHLSNLVNKIARKINLNIQKQNKTKQTNK